MESKGEQIATAVRFPGSPNKMLRFVHTNIMEVTGHVQNSADKVLYGVKYPQASPCLPLGVRLNDGFTLYMPSMCPEH